MGLFSRRDKDGYDKNGYDKDGYDRLGFDVNDKHRETGTQFDPNGIHRITGTKYDFSGFDADGNTKSKTDLDEKKIKDFSRILNERDTEFDQIIEIEYDTPTTIKTKLFFNQEEKIGLRSKIFSEYSEKNVLHIHIEKTSKENNTTWNYGGQFEIGDNFESGYTMYISILHNDEKLRKTLIGILNKLNFGCFPSNYSIICHFDEEFPNEQGAKELLQLVIEKINSLSIAKQLEEE